MSAQDLADLRWLLQSPPLLDTAPGAFSAGVQQFSGAESVQIERWLAGLHAQPAPLRDYLQEASPVATQPASPQPGPSQRLGRRAERLLEFFLRHGPTHRLVTANIALRDVAPGALHSTRGEIDFLLEDLAGRRWHWELAVKFYMSVAAGPVARLSDFIGPQRNDTLAAKIDKTFGRQLRHLPPAPWNEHEWMPAAFVRGWLFYPHGRPRPQVAGLHAQHRSGTWLMQRQLATLTPGDWRWLPRHRWLSTAAELAEPLSPVLNGTGAALQRPALAVRLERGAEVERVFVVPDAW